MNPRLTFNATFRNIICQNFVTSNSIDLIKIDNCTDFYLNNISLTLNSISSDF